MLPIGAGAAVLRKYTPRAGWRRVYAVRHGVLSLMQKNV